MMAEELEHNDKYLWEEKNIDNLKTKVISKLSEEFEIIIPPECHDCVIRVLRMEDYNVQSAVRFFICHIQGCKDLKDMWQKFDPVARHYLIQIGFITVLKNKDELGRQILILRCGRWDPDVVDFDQTTLAPILMLTFANEISPDTQRNGIVLILNFVGFGFKQMRNTSPTRLVQTMKLIDAAPGKVEQVHFIFHSKFFNIVYQMFKSVLDVKMLSKIYFHGNDTSSLHKHISPTILPDDLGGKLEENDAVDWPLMNALDAEDWICSDILKYGLPTK